MDLKLKDTIWNILMVSYLLFKVPPFLLIHKHQVEVVAYGELFIYVPHGGCQVIPSQEHPDGDTFTSHWCSIHDLILGNGFILIEGVGSCGERFHSDKNGKTLLELKYDTYPKC